MQNFCFTQQILYRYSCVFGTISQITAVLITAVEQTYRFVGLCEFNTVEENNNPLIIITLICVPYKSETSVGLYYCYTHVIILRVTDANRNLDVMAPENFRGWTSYQCTIRFYNINFPTLLRWKLNMSSVQWWIQGGRAYAPQDITRVAYYWILPLIINTIEQRFSTILYPSTT